MTTVLQGLATTGLEVPATIIILILVLLAVMVVAAAAVALFHPDATRRKDARAVLTTLVPRRRR